MKMKFLALFLSILSIFFSFSQTKAEILFEEKFEDNNFDTVVCTFVLCSVPNPVVAVKEMLRVLKPDGRLILLEHVLSKMPLIAFIQRLFNPFTRGIFGYNIDRDTVTYLKQGNALILKDQNLTKSDILKFLICKKT